MQHGAGIWHQNFIIFAFWYVLGVNCIRNEDEEGKESKYKFEYSVNDRRSGNIHSREEERRGGVLSGQYSAHFPDGFKRTVVYNVNGDSGFVATVHKEKIHNCYHCMDAAPFSVGYEIQHHSPDSHVKSFFYMDSGIASSIVEVDSDGTRIHRKTKHLSPLIHLNKL
ncbi:unnamed protein product [Nezara viridula]|uniref:Uncharacterized protein n=1 Tax=Nezara viridula TaxID=85310 RepID=A0A9P0HJV9_NEZVI|nr:unnamed protein product [Nezara viridula]